MGEALKAPLSGKASFIVGTIGGLALAGAVFVPDPWRYLVGALGFIACVLAGVAAAPPTAVAGKPILQGTAFSVASVLMATASQFYPLIPQGWPQGLALGILGILGWLTGKVLPAPLSAVQPQPSLPSVETKEEAIDVLKNGTKGPPES